jgi:acetyl esterase
MALDAQAKAFLESIASTGAPALSTMTPEQGRAFFGQMHALGGEVEEVAKVENHVIQVADGEFKVRVYTPEGTGPFPLFIYYHGGGYVVGDVDLVDRLSRTITNAAQVIVVSVDYRLAPEHKYPVPVNDGYAAVEWAYNNAGHFNGDASRIAVGGDSAGGNLAAVTSLKAKQEKGPHITAQVLLYPVTDFACESESYNENGTDYNLTTLDMIWFRDHYLSSATEIEDVYVSPLRSNNLADLPQALIITAQFDPLRDDGARYAEKLKQYGNQVEYQCYEGMIHGFAWFAGVLDQGKAVITHVSHYLKQAFEQK